MTSARKPSPPASSDFEISEEQLRYADRALDKLVETLQFLTRNYERLLSRYPERWLALEGRRIAGAGESRQRLARELRTAGENVAELHLEFLARKPRRGSCTVFRR